MWKHWVGRALYPYEPFNEFESALWFWKKLKEVFPEMISAVLMPNHFHLLLPQDVAGRADVADVVDVVNVTDAAVAKKIAGLLGSMSVRDGLKRPWQRLPTPTQIPDALHLRRQVRYLALNPCRKNLCKDPLEWYWSTYREVMGAAIAQNQNEEKLARMARILRESPKDFRVRFHSYVSGDPSVQVVGTPFPKPAIPKQFPEKSISDILAASAGALRVKPDQVRERGPLRRLFIHLAYRHGWRRPIFLAHLCGITPAGVHQILHKGIPVGIEVADLCLGDTRLRPKSEGIMDFMKNIESAETTSWSQRFL